MGRAEERASTRVLVVEDSVVISRMLSALLGYDGYDVVGVAENGSVALEMAEVLEPDVILLDVTMPGMGGVETLRRLKDRHGSNILVVMVSGIIDPDAISECTDLGAEAFIPKPFSIDRVRKVLGRILGREKLGAVADGKSIEDPLWAGKT